MCFYCRAKRKKDKHIKRKQKKHSATPGTMTQSNNVAKSDKWCLEVINNDDSDSEISVTETYFLNVGRTDLGRNVKADLITDSEFASRNHCFIELTDSDELFLTDSSSNGTYVNAEHVTKERVPLKMNDLIGIGCTIDSPRNREITVGDGDNKITRIYKSFVYKLINCTAPKIADEIISLSSDEENDKEPQRAVERESIAVNAITHKRAVTNGNDYDVMDLLESGDEMLVDCVSGGGAVGQLTANENANRTYGNMDEDADDKDDDIEQNQWSQQVVLNIKEEAQLFVISDDDDDGSKENYDNKMELPNDNNNDQDENDNENDYDDDTSRWLSRLSQDQDKVQEKSAGKLQQKRAKIIDSMPMKRRRSICGKASTNTDPPKRRKSVSISSSASVKSSPLVERRKSVSSARPKMTIKLDGFINSKRHEIAKKDLAECRKARLLEIAQNEQIAKLGKGTHSKERVATKPKVKMSESRGAFLQEPIAIEKKRLKSKSEVDENRKQYQMIGVPSTSKGPSKSDELGPAYVDHFDPFAVGLRKSLSEHPKTIDDALAEIDKQYAAVPKKRTARVKSSYTSTTNDAEPKKKNASGVHTVSILKKVCNGKEAKGLNVIFRDEVVNNKSGHSNELVDLFEFEAGENECDEIIVNVPPCDQNVPRSEFQSDPLHRIISEVTSWDVDWLSKKNKVPPITGVDYVITPLLSKYPSFEVFQNTITPLLMHELWASIIADMEKDSKTLNNKIHITFNDVNLEKRGVDVRHVYHCEVVSECNRRILPGDLVVVRNGASQFFAYVTDQRTIRNGYMRTTHFSMEAAPANANKNITCNTFSVTVTPITNIRTELKLFSAVYTLKNSAMKQYILDPLAHVAPREPPQFADFRYLGYDPLNNEQLKVLGSIYCQCMSQIPGVSLVEGPPGTGKSRLIVNLILQLVFGERDAHRRLRILVCAHSNAAVDILALKLKKIRAKTTPAEKQKKLRIVRFGVVDSMDREVRSMALQTLVKLQPNAELQSPQSQTLLEEKSKLEAKIEAMSKTTAIVNDVSADYFDGLRRRLNQLNETLERKKSVMSKNERHHSHELMTGANIICTTLSSSINLKQYVNKFDVCIVDEASQCIEPWSMIPLLFGINSLILVGDSQQLPAVVLSTVGRDNNLERSLFTRLQEICADLDHKPNMYSLCQQYRMNPAICHWSNNYFYQQRLVSAQTTNDTTFQLNPYGVFSLDFLQSCNDGINYHNSDEAKFIIDLLRIIVRYAVPKQYSYGIITPYSTQRKELQNHINTTPEFSPHNFPVNTIDSYQGQEKDVIILSTTRTDGVGFLSNPQRLNVALTRAKRCLLVCGNFTSVKQVRVWKSLLSDATERRLLHIVPKKYTQSDLARMLLRPDVPANDNNDR